MVDIKLCEWLADNADLPIRYRVMRELLKDIQAAKDIEKELYNNPTIALWLKTLKPESPPQHHWMEHGSFHFCLENALLKSIGLGLHAGLPPVADALTYYVTKFTSAQIQPPVRDCNFRGGFDHIITSNLLALAGVNHNVLHSYLQDSLDELYRFAIQGDYNIYCSDKERSEMKGLPQIWQDCQIIKPGILNRHGFCYPFIYDIVGLHTLYGLNPHTDEKINAIIDYISTDKYHDSIADDYGIITTDNKKYYAMGWDAKFPGWHDVEGYLNTPNASRLLFFAQYIAKYPTARSKKWFKNMLSYLEKYRTDSGTYQFPAGWLKEKQGYAVTGSHLSFGEDRRKKKWREIESTFYVQMIYQNIPS